MKTNTTIETQGQSTALRCNALVRRLKRARFWVSKTGRVSLDWHPAHGVWWTRSVGLIGIETWRNFEPPFRRGLHFHAWPITLGIFWSAPNTKFRDAGGQSPALRTDDQPHSL